MTWLFVLLVLVVTILAWRALRPRPASPGAVEQHREVAQARAAAVVETKAADQRLEEARKTPAVPWVNDWLKRRRGPGALVLALLLTPGAAWADCVDQGEVVTCPRADFEEIKAGLQEAEHDRDVALAEQRRLDRELRAALVRVEVLEQAPQPEQPSPWTDRLAGAAGALAVVLAAALLVR